MAKDLREDYAGRFDGLNIPNAKKFAKFIRQKDDQAPRPCWGALAERFDEEFDDDARVSLWSLFREVDDDRGLLVFLYVNRDRPAVIDEVLKDLSLLPVALQRAVVCLVDDPDKLTLQLSALAPAVQQLVEQGADALRRERDLVQSRIARLLSSRYFIPVDPDTPEEK